MNHLRMTIVVGVLLTGGCELADIGTEVKYVGPFQTARPLDCRMQMLFGPLPYPHQDVARARTECPDHMATEELCFDSMRSKACVAGADVIYEIAETREGEVRYLNATFARSLPGPVDSAISTAPAERTCNPICSPGFACQRGTCLPQCNPTCAADEICTRQRLCSPTHKVSQDSRAQARREIATVISWDHPTARHEAGNEVEGDAAARAAARADVASGDRAIRRAIRGAVPGPEAANPRPAAERDLPRADHPTEPRF